MGAGIDRIKSNMGRHRYALRDVGLGALVVATGVLVTTVLTNGPDGTATLVASGSPDPTQAAPSAGESPLEPSPPSPSAETAAAPPPSPSAIAPSSEPTPEPPAVRTPRPSPTSSRRVAAGYPAKGLRLEVVARADGVLAGRTTVRVRDTDGSWNGGYIAFGDGRRQDFARSKPACEKRSAPEAASPSDVTRTFWHAYDTAGSYEVVVLVRTERFCSGAPVEESSRSVRVTIAGPRGSTPSPEPVEEPTPEPTPAAEPTPDPTSEPTSGPRPR